MLIKSVFLFVAILGIFVVAIALRPSEFCITRTTAIAAPASMVFDQVNDFHLWEAWSPWAKLDPASKTNYEGATSGVGSIFHWAGNQEVGAGAMTLIESQPSERIRIRLEFLKPFEATNFSEFTFKPEGSGTVVTWSMTGKNNFVGKAVGLLMNCDKMVGGQFEKGLANLKSVVESATHP